jgi:hypothetical protein
MTLELVTTQKLLAERNANEALMAAQAAAERERLRKEHEDNVAALQEERRTQHEEQVSFGVFEGRLCVVSVCVRVVLVVVLSLPLDVVRVGLCSSYYSKVSGSCFCRSHYLFFCTLTHLFLFYNLKKNRCGKRWMKLPPRQRNTRPFWRRFTPTRPRYESIGGCVVLVIGKVGVWCLRVRVCCPSDIHCGCVVLAIDRYGWGGPQVISNQINPFKENKNVRLPAYSQLKRALVSTHTQRLCVCLVFFF